MTKVFGWLKRYWYVPLIAIGAALGFFVGRGGVSRSLRRELDAIDAAERARLDAVDQGADAANAAIDAEHRATIAELDAELAAKSERLRSDPARRAKWLTRLANGDG